MKPAGQEEFDAVKCMDCGETVSGAHARPGPTCLDCFSARLRAPQGEGGDGS